MAVGEAGVGGTGGGDWCFGGFYEGAFDAVGFGVYPFGVSRYFLLFGFSVQLYSNGDIFVHGEFQADDRLLLEVCVEVEEI